MNDLTMFWLIYLCLVTTAVSKDRTSTWGEWSTYGPCSTTCSWGYASRKRTCIMETPHGDRCALRNGTRATTEVQVKKCMGLCEGNGEWGQWSPASQCPYSCERSERKVARACDSPPPRSDGELCLTRKGTRDLAEFSTEPCPPSSQCIHKCKKERGICVKSDGSDQNNGVVQLNSDNMLTAQAQESCFEKCLNRSNATGCEVVLNQPNKGCYVHTKSVGKGNLVDNHYCWIFSKCKTELDCSVMFCQFALFPVCGSNRISYNNKCLFEQARCRNNSLYIIHKGKCMDPCESIQCGQGRNFASCATNGQTYNGCDLAIQTCKNSSITFLHPGPCKSCDKIICTEQLTPVCGSDGKTYDNGCKLKRAACTDNSITMKHRGRCKIVFSCRKWRK